MGFKALACMFGAVVSTVCADEMCPPGFYRSVYLPSTHSIECEECPKGTYGDSFGLLDRNCSGLCAPGFFGSTSGQTSLQCSGRCAAGYYCPAGSTQPRTKVCGGEGYYCPAGSGARKSVLEGYYTEGETVLTRESQKRCEFGFYCANGVKMPCPAGTYGNRQGLTNELCSGYCPPGYYSLEASSECSKCRPGTFGNVSGLTSPSCSGNCSPGYYCPASVVNTDSHMFPCPPGVYSSDSGLQTKECSLLCSGDDFCVATTVCEEGFYCPSAATEQLPCGGSDRYCPAGSGNYTLVSVGHYTVGSIQSSANATDRNIYLNQASERPCPNGFYCDGSGLKKPCPPGTYGRDEGLTSLECNGPCDEGYYCEEQSIYAYQKRCGSNDKYCPSGSAGPLQVSSGYYTTGGTPTTRFNQSICEPGFYCDGSGRRLRCSAGTYGESFGLTTSDCSGKCPRGFYCPEGSTSPIANPCPAGTFGKTEGLKDNKCSGPCKAGFFCPSASTSETEVRCSYNMQPYKPDSELTVVGAVVGTAYGTTNGVYNRYPQDLVYCPEGSGEPLDVPADHFALGLFGEKHTLVAESQTAV